MLQTPELHVCVGLILYGESEHALETLAALQQQELDIGTNISLVIVDNGIPQTLKAEIWELYAGKMLYLQNVKNFGFSAAANQCLAEAQKFQADFLLLLNPDLLLETVAIREFLNSAVRHPQTDFFTPKLLKANQDLEPIEPAVIDACGMLMYSNIRHLDRGSSEKDTGQYQIEEKVFGGTGACLLIRLINIARLCLPRNQHEAVLYKIYPQLEQGAEQRPQLFDEAFFAYREDADLALRAQILGASYVYCPVVVGYHIRRVLPENRKDLPAEINLYGVRNRFLLQLNNIKIISSFSIFIKGILIRNLLVALAVILKERSSLQAFKQLWILRKRAFANRNYIRVNSNKLQYKNCLQWFQ